MSAHWRQGWDTDAFLMTLATMNGPGDGAQTSVPPSAPPPEQAGSNGTSNAGRTIRAGTRRQAMPLVGAGGPPPAANRRRGIPTRLAPGLGAAHAVVTRPPLPCPGAPH